MADSTSAVSPAAPLQRASSLRAFLDAVRAACDDGSFELADPVQAAHRGAATEGDPGAPHRAQGSAGAVVRRRARDARHHQEPRRSTTGSLPSPSISTRRAPRRSPTRRCARTAPTASLLVSKKGHATLRRHVRAVEGKSPATAATGRPVPRSRQRAAPPAARSALAGRARPHRRAATAWCRRWRASGGRSTSSSRSSTTRSMRRRRRQRPRAPARRRLRLRQGLPDLRRPRHLRRRFGVAPEVTGVELRADLVALCNGVAARCALRPASLRRRATCAASRRAAMDVMIALHACDTATDHAIDLGVRAGARDPHLLAVLPQGAAPAAARAAPALGRCCGTASTSARRPRW